MAGALPLGSESGVVRHSIRPRFATPTCRHRPPLTTLSLAPVMLHLLVVKSFVIFFDAYSWLRGCHSLSSCVREGSGPLQELRFRLDASFFNSSSRRRGIAGSAVAVDAGTPEYEIRKYEISAGLNSELWIPASLSDTCSASPKSVGFWH
jgi:hypothetical protein